MCKEGLQWQIKKKKKRLFLEPIPIIDFEYISRNSLNMTTILGTILILSTYTYIFYELLLPYTNRGTYRQIFQDFSKDFSTRLKIILSMQSTKKVEMI